MPALLRYTEDDDPFYDPPQVAYLPACLPAATGTGARLGHGQPWRGNEGEGQEGQGQQEGLEGGVPPMP